MNRAFYTFRNLPTVIILLSIYLYPQQITPKFEHLTLKNGLPENSVYGIEQDYLGYMWFGTQNGLVRYDGYSMKVYQSELKGNTDEDGIRFIYCIYEDKSKNLWIGTNGGLIKYVRDKDSFINYTTNHLDSNSINSNLINCIYEDNSSKLWIGTDKGLNLFDRKNENFTHNFFNQSHLISDTSRVSSIQNLEVAVNSIIEYPSTGYLLLAVNKEGLFSFNISKRTLSKFNLNFTQKPKRKIGDINSLCLSQDSTLWIGSSSGVVKLNQKNNVCKLYSDFYSEVNPKRENFTQVIESKSGLLYIGLSNGGLTIFNPDNEQYTTFLSEDNQSESLISHYINRLYEDRSGILWIGTWGGGLSKYDQRKIKFNSLMSDTNNPNSISSNTILSIMHDNKNIMWISTDRAVDKLERLSGIIDHFLEYYSKSDYYTEMLQDTSGYVWICTYNRGIIKFNPSNKTHTFYFNDPKDSINFINSHIETILKDHLGYLWFGTFGHGLYSWNPVTGTVKVFRHSVDNPKSIDNDQVIEIYEDSHKTLWVGTNRGLNRFNREDNTFSSAKLTSVSTIYEDRKGNFWIGTYLHGLILYDRIDEKVISSFTENDGLANNATCSIIEDNSGNLWIGTPNGLSRFNIENKSFKNYSSKDGLNSDRFRVQCVSKNTDGELYFGVWSGINYFNPDIYRDNSIPPQVTLSNVSLFNRPEEKLSYDGFISDLDVIELPYDNNDLYFEYVGLHYSDPQRNKYKYVLEGFDKKWIDAGYQRAATYTNLDPGEYVFRVIASNSDGIWNEAGTSIKIIILPPWWATTWSYIIYVLIILSIIYFTWKLQLNRIRIKHNYEMSKFEAEKLQEVNEMKNRFFANISHEFRTPLTLIFGPAKDIAVETKETKTKQNAGIIKRNAGRLYGLVNQLLDLSKLEAGKMKLEATEQNIMPLLKGLVLSFSSLAERKKISLKFNTIEENLKVYIDKEKIEKVINNLLSNAFNFTPEGGEIDFTVEKLIKEAEIRITDNGVGIPKERINKIFDRFYQVDGSHTRESEGTGIGLALTKELVELHKGKIKVESNEGEGTTFTVLLPLGKEHLKPDEIVEKDNQPETIEKTELTPETENRKEKTDIDLLIDNDKPLLLIVEDNSDVRHYIISHLEEDYRIQEAIDGEDGLNQALNHIPDLIISDVMMPKMDGFELCNKLKTDGRTSHIPIIMLTAKATSQDKIEGYEIGADDYIMKPFDATELRARIKNLIEIRRKLQERFSSENFVIPKELSPLDEQFLNKVLEVINEHISEEEFSIEEMGKESAMSRGQIYKKLKALTGKSPSLFLRSVRLAKAKKMIKDGNGVISEIAYSVGFGSPAYFSKCFNEEFGFPPSELHNL